MAAACARSNDASNRNGGADLSAASLLNPQQRSALDAATCAVNSALDARELLQVSVEAAIEALGLDTGAIYTVDGGVLYLGATTPALPPDFPLHLRYALIEDHPHIDECLRKQCPIHLRDAQRVHLSTDERAAVQARNLTTILYVPLMANASPVGVMILGTHENPVDFPPDMLELTDAVASQIAMTLASTTD